MSQWKYTRESRIQNVWAFESIHFELLIVYRVYRKSGQNGIAEEKSIPR